MERRIFIGDVHGCFDELQELLNKLSWNTKQDQVYLTGDLINRGPKSYEVLSFVKENDFNFVLGNHEVSFLKYLKEKKQGHPFFDEIVDQLGDKVQGFYDYINSKPFFIEEDDFILVHAGLTPGKSPAESRREDLYKIRTWDAKGEVTNDLSNPPWYEFYSGTKPVIYGHFAQDGLKVRKNTIGLDSGCVWGRYLSAYIFETREVIQVQSKEAYAKLKR